MMTCNFEGDLNQSCFEKQFNKIVLHKKYYVKKYYIKKYLIKKYHIKKYYTKK